MNVNGKVSWFGGPHDATDSGHTASGGTTKEPGIAVYNHGTLGGYWRVRAPNGKVAVLRQTDIGPAPWTGRKVDVTYSALGQLGYNEGNFPTNSQVSAEYLGHNPNAAVKAQSAKAYSIPGRPGRAEVPAKETFDAKGFKEAQGKAAVGKLLAAEHTPGGNPLLSLGIFRTKAPTEAEFTGETKAQPAVPGEPGHTIKAEGSPTSVYVPHRPGLADFGGKQVASWIEPALQYARAHGWRGTVTSGFRSRAEQERIYNSGVRPAAVPGTSNHEGDAFPRGAVDVSEAQQLARILEGSHYRGLLVWAGAKDPVHFSHPHGGSY